MEKHIALLFLSDFKTYKEKIKDEVTGQSVDTGRILLQQKNDYYGKEGFVIKGRHTNEPAVYYLLKKYQQLDKIFIFASDKVRSAFKYVDDQGILHESKDDTHLQLFKDTITTRCASMTDKQLPQELFEVVAYEEPTINSQEDYKSWSYDSNNADFASILDMATKVKAYCDKVKQAEGEAVEIHLHVDMTGGFRHANMLMLAVIDLLKYSGLQVDDVIYTNFDMGKRVGKIEEVTNIHNIFQLVAGAEEFSNYGSVKTLDKYFASVKKSRKLDKLINSMRNFSDVLKLCRTGMLEIVVKRLKKNIENYRSENANSSNTSQGGAKLSNGVISEEEKVFGELLDTIEAKYKVFFKNDKINYVNIIDWCFTNDFIQQALTFFVELIPTYVVNNKILYPSEEVNEVEHFIKKDQEPAKKTNKENLTSWQQKLSNFEVEDIVDDEVQKPWMMDMLRCYVPYEASSSENGKDKKRKSLDILKSLLSKYGNKAGSKNTAKKRIEFFLKFYSSDFEKLIQNNYEFKKFFTTNEASEDFCKYLLRQDDRTLRRTIGFEDIDYENTQGDYIYISTAKNRNKVVERMLEKGFVCTEWPENNYHDVLELIFQYNKIRKIRNIVNHASAKDEISNDRIREELEEAIKVFKDFDRRIDG